MKFAPSILTLSAVAAANNMADMALPPACAASCFTDLHQSNQCQIMDYKCLCGDRDFVTSMAKCINGACNGADAASTKDWAEKQCQDNYGIDISGDFGDQNKMNTNMRNMVRGMWRSSSMKDGMKDGLKAGTEEAMKMKNDMMLKDEMKKGKMNLKEDMKMKDTMKNHM
ncbi:hypothetical protein KJ359_009871 [Pestalotiopsis sp. 9143b]|nr:hypothetical protein KJ359_009871 [Pestalotiopsis sp. 9143b]